MKGLRFFLGTVIAATFALILFSPTGVFAEVTLAGGNKPNGQPKKYGGVFVGGIDLVFDKKAKKWIRNPGGEPLFEDNLEAYTRKLRSISGSGWTEDNMSVIPPDLVSLETIRNVINRFKPGGANALEPGDEFQFVYVGHGPTPMFKDGPDSDTDWDDLPIATLAEWLSGFPRSVTMAVILNSCGSKGDANLLARTGVKDSEDKPLDPNHLCIGWAAEGPTNYIIPSWAWGLPDWLPLIRGTSFMEELTDGVEDAMESGGKAPMKDVIKDHVVAALKDKNKPDNDLDGRLDEDGASPWGEYGKDALCYDDDGDGFIDEDPAPQEAGYIEGCILVYNPEPNDGAENIDPALEYLRWTASEIVANPSYDVYFGTDPNVSANPKIASGIDVQYVDPPPVGDLDFDTAYFWHVDVIGPGWPGDPNDFYKGPTWTFRTWPAAPLIIRQPERIVTVQIGETAQFTIDSGGSQAGTHNYQWYKEPDIPLSDGGGISGTTTDVLTISNVDITDEGYYYCVVSNSHGLTESDAGRLLTPRLMAHWKFDGNAEDQTGNYHGVEVGEPNYETGIDGLAVQIHEPNHYIIVEDAIGVLKEVTVSIWIKPYSFDNIQPLLTPSDGNTGYEPWYFVMMYTVGDALWGSVWESAYVRGGSLVAGEWNHCVFVYDRIEGLTRLHLNGEPVAQEQIITPGEPTLLPMAIGFGQEYGLYFDSGLIDDLRIWNYPLTPLEIASMYISFVPEARPCIGSVESDLNGDCIVNLLDLALVASNWLECNKIPDCIPMETP